MATRQQNDSRDDQTSEELLSYDPNRKVRAVSGAIGQSFPVDALREAGIADRDGELVTDELYAPQKVRRVGDVLKIEIEIPLDDLEN